MNLTNFLIWLSPLVNSIASAYSPKNTNNEVDINATSVLYGSNGSLDSFLTKMPFDLLKQEKETSYLAEKLESKTVPLERYFNPALFRTEDNTPYFQTSNPKMSITLKNFTDDQIPRVKASIREAIKTFDSTIGIIVSEKEHECTLTKWDAPHGFVYGLYIPRGQDKENQNVIRCEITAVIGTTEEYDGSALVHEVGHAIQYYNTDGREIRTLLSEGIAAFVQHNNDNSKNLINSAHSLFDNKALQNYNDDQVLENSIGRYTIGPVIIRYWQETALGTVRNFLECRKNEEEPQCVATHLKPYFNVSKFKKWLRDNADTTTATEQKDTPFVMICNPKNSKYEISSCDSGTIEWAEKEFNNHTAMYQIVQGCFPHKQKHIPSDSDIIVYYDNYKISYNTKLGASLNAIQYSSVTTYDYGIHWGKWLLEQISRVEKNISDGDNCDLIQQEIDQNIINGMRNCHATTNSVQTTTTVQPTTTPYHVDKILLIKCESSDSPCAVFHCNTLNGLDIVDSYIREHCRSMPITTDNHQGNQNIAVTIVKNDNTIQQVECINGWGNWLMKQIEDSTINNRFANEDIPKGCRSTTNTTPTQSEDNNTEGNSTENSTNYSIPLAIVGAAGLIATIMYAINKIKSGNGSVAYNEPIYEIPEQQKKTHITKEDIKSPSLDTTTLSPTIPLINIANTENLVKVLLGTYEHIYDVPFESPLLGQHVILHIEND